MDKVKIKRVARKKKFISVKEKVMAGLGVGTSLLGAATGGMTASPKSPQRIVSSSNGRQASNVFSELGGLFQKYLGVPVAKADSGAAFYMGGGDTSGMDPDMQGQCYGAIKSGGFDSACQFSGGGEGGGGYAPGDTGQDPGAQPAPDPGNLTPDPTEQPQPDPNQTPPPADNGAQPPADPVQAPDAPPPASQPPVRPDQPPVQPPAQPPAPDATVQPPADPAQVPDTAATPPLPPVQPDSDPAPNPAPPAPQPPTNPVNLDPTDPSNPNYVNPLPQQVSPANNPNYIAPPRNTQPPPPPQQSTANLVLSNLPSGAKIDSTPVNGYYPVYDSSNNNIGYAPNPNSKQYYSVAYFNPGGNISNASSGYYDLTNGGNILDASGGSMDQDLGVGQFTNFNNNGVPQQPTVTSYDPTNTTVQSSAAPVTMPPEVGGETVTWQNDTTGYDTSGNLYVLNQDSTVTRYDGNNETGTFSPTDNFDSSIAPIADTAPSVPADASTGAATSSTIAAPGFVYDQTTGTQVSENLYAANTGASQNLANTISFNPTTGIGTDSGGNQYTRDAAGNISSVDQLEGGTNIIEAGSSQNLQDLLPSAINGQDVTWNYSNGQIQGTINNTNQVAYFVSPNTLTGPRGQALYNISGTVYDSQGNEYFQDVESGQYVTEGTQQSGAQSISGLTENPDQITNEANQQDYQASLAQSPQQPSSVSAAASAAASSSSANPNSNFNNLSATEVSSAVTPDPSAVNKSVTNLQDVVTQKAADGNDVSYDTKTGTYYAANDNSKLYGIGEDGQLVQINQIGNNQSPQTPAGMSGDEQDLIINNLTDKLATEQKIYITPVANNPGQYQVEDSTGKTVRMNADQLVQIGDNLNLLIASGSSSASMTVKDLLNVPASDSSEVASPVVNNSATIISSSPTTGASQIVTTLTPDDLSQALKNNYDATDPSGIKAIKLNDQTTIHSSDAVNYTDDQGNEYTYDPSTESFDLTYQATDRKQYTITLGDGTVLSGTDGINYTSEDGKRIYKFDESSEKLQTQNAEGNWKDINDNGDIVVEQSTPTNSGVIDTLKQKKDKAKEEVGNVFGSIKTVIPIIKSSSPDTQAGKVDKQTGNVTLKDGTVLTAYNNSKTIFQDQYGNLYSQSGKTYTYTGVWAEDITSTSAPLLGTVIGPGGNVLQPLNGTTYRDPKTGNLYEVNEDGTTMPTGIKMAEDGSLQSTNILYLDNKDVSKTVSNIAKDTGKSASIGAVLGGGLFGGTIKGTLTAVKDLTANTSNAVIAWASNPGNYYTPGKITVGSGVALDKFDVQAALAAAGPNKNDQKNAVEGLILQANAQKSQGSS